MDLLPFSQDRGPSCTPDPVESAEELNRSPVSVWLEDELSEEALLGVWKVSKDLEKVKQIFRCADQENIGGNEMGVQINRFYEWASPLHRQNPRLVDTSSSARASNASSDS